MPTSLTRSYM
ncbi:hypothetical protein F383_06471 [Gossypium arboreum]|uniref:Uncharacterized protein n=1 Tax=Gossypium arboreum TaxID=29729 RepID=A0A0B0NKQ6_GOSAR|nr:hypothetical protein F383_17479 [Gossypium arboreum]KHG12967.1 hypothetical protein F383_06471 [Gossypium arboreum]